MSVNYSWISHSLCRLEQWIAINIGSVEGGGSSDVIISKSKTLLTEETEHSKSEEALSVLRFIYSFYSWGSKLFFFPLYFCMHVLPPLTVSTWVQLCMTEVCLLITVFWWCLNVQMKPWPYHIMCESLFCVDCWFKFCDSLIFYTLNWLHFSYTMVSFSFTMLFFTLCYFFTFYSKLPSFSYGVFMVCQLPY